MTPLLIDKQDYPELGLRLEKELGFNRSGFEKGYFPNGEFFCRFLEPLKNQDVYILQACSSHQDFMELFITIQAAQKNGARRIILVLPYFSYTRQDRIISNSGIPVQLIAKLLEASGGTHLITFDLHSPDKCFFSFPVYNLHFADLIAQKLLKNPSLAFKDCVVVSPDKGGGKRTQHLSKLLQIPLITIEKKRMGPGQSLSLDLDGNVIGKRCLILDDLVDSGNTLCESAGFLIEKGGQSVEAYATHGILSGRAFEKIEESLLASLVISNTLPLSEISCKIHVCPIDELIFENIKMFVNFP